MPQLRCLGCARVGPTAETIIQVWRNSLTRRFQVVLCSTCFWAMMDLYEVSSSFVQASFGDGGTSKRSRRGG
jgi:hypothetical protein